jgi:moderate conductance mechanosensitive channel
MADAAAVTPARSPPPPGDDGLELGATGAVTAVDTAIVAVLSDVSALPTILGAVSARAEAETGLSLVALLGLCLAVLLVAYGLERIVRRVVRRPVPPVGHSFAERLYAAAARLAGRLGFIALFVLAALLIGLLLVPPGGGRDVLRLALAVVTLQRAVYALFLAIVVPGAPTRRLVPLTEPSASRLHLLTLAVLVAVGVLRFASGLLAGTGAAGLQILLAAIWAVLAASYFFAIRREVGQVIRAAWGSARPAELFARHWHLVYAGLAILSALSVAASLAGATDRSAAFSFGFLILVFAPFLLGGIRALRAEAAQGGALPPARAARFALVEGAAVLLVACLLLAGWGIHPFAEAEETGRVGRALVSALAALAVGIAAWRAAEALLRPRVPQTGDALLADEGEGGGAPRSRLETILPVLRGFVLVFIAIITAMAGLSALGVDIGPLLAGAGVFGIAIGFGAQKFVADVIGGLFYLYEDAFRVGEYIETESGKGMVERISLRSVRLRHHRGSVFTIPFSSMGTIQNHSRDWVKIKFTFAIPVATDVEKVRKLVKRVGAELAADPELEGQFLDPLKSQGAIAIHDAAFDIGVKFTCRPGRQFLIRRKAYAALQKALHENGIELYRPGLMVETRPDAKPGPGAVSGAP